MDKEIISRLKHIETFYEQAPPGYVKEKEEKPEDCIPDEEGNKAARDFLANAPSKGLWMPLGKEVKVMQCWRCKNYGHRTGDKECPLFRSGNAANDKFREVYEDPMYHFVEKSKREENEKKKMWLQHLVDMPTTSGSSSEDESGIKKKKKKNKKKKHKRDSKKHKKKKSLKSNSSDSEDDKPNSKKDSKYNKETNSYSTKKREEKRDKRRDKIASCDSEADRKVEHGANGSKDRKRSHDNAFKSKEGSKYSEFSPKKGEKHKSRH